MIHCFRCGKALKKREVCHDRYKRHPRCQDCLRENINEDFDFGEDYVFDEVIKSFNGNYDKYWDWLEKTCEICDKCNTWTDKDSISNGFCQNCIEREEESYKNITNSHHWNGSVRGGHSK